MIYDLQWKWSEERMTWISQQYQESACCFITITDTQEQQIYVLAVTTKRADRRIIVPPRASSRTDNQRLVLQGYMNYSWKHKSRTCTAPSQALGSCPGENWKYSKKNGFSQQTCCQLRLVPAPWTLELCPYRWGTLLPNKINNQLEAKPAKSVKKLEIAWHCQDASIPQQLPVI